MTFHVHRAYEKKRRCLMESEERRKLGKFKLKNKLKKRRLVCEIFDQKSKSILRKIIELGVMKPSVMIVHFKISKNKMQILDIEDILDEVYRVIAQICMGNKAIQLKNNST